MPFTLSHPAAVLIFTRSGLPMVGLIAGSMAPDVPMILPTPYSYQHAHSAVGIPTVDVLAGMVLALLWTFLVRDPVVDAGPAWLRERAGVTAALSGRQLWLLPAAVILGAGTHVLWDEFTHQGRWGAAHIPWLAENHLGYAGYHWAQAASSVLGLATVIVVGALTLARRPARPTPTCVPALARRSGALVVGSATVAAVVAGTLRADRGLHAAAIAAAVNGIGALAVTGVIAAAVWQVARARG